MAHEIQFSDQSIADLEDAINNLWLVSQGAAERFNDDHDRCVQDLMSFANLGRSERAGRRSLPVGRSGYRIVYRVENDTVVVLRLRNVRRPRQSFWDTGVGLIRPTPRRAITIQNI